jgi:CRISPR-associated protein Csb1
MTDLAHLLDAPRIKLVAELEPIAGTRFQPAGFPDLGPATYASPLDGRRLLLVESAQSMANWLEGRLWNASGDGPVEAVAALPYVRVLDSGGEHLTSSRTESHRLASAYVKAAMFGEQTGLELIGERLGLAKQRPIDHGRVARTIFDLDPLCLLHGCFFADEKWPGQPKIARALTGFVEASGVQEAYSGGVKFDHVSNSGDKEAGKAAEQGYGNVPFPRTEFVAESIEASFVLDVSQIRRYALDAPERELLLAVALYEIRSLLDEGLRLRTACDLAVTGVRGELPTGFELPDLDSLERAIRERATAMPPLDGVYGA